MTAHSKKLNAPMIRAAKERGERLVVTTAYDATFARLLDEGGADVLLVGDSLGMVVQGLGNTLPVTLDDMIYHTRAVVRGAVRAHVVTDMPFMSYQVGVEDALRAAGELVKRGGAEAVKLEGGERTAPAVERIVAAGIPVMGHVGLTPQSVHEMGGFRVQGRSEAAVLRLRRDAIALEQAGAYALVVEGVPSDVGAELTSSLGIPTIGIGAGPHCDGQVLVCYDLLGLFRDFTPKFVKRYAELGQGVVAAMERYALEVREGTFPGAEHSFSPRRAPHEPAPPLPEPTGAQAIVGEPVAAYGPASEEDA